MKHPGTKRNYHQKQQTDAWAQRTADSGVYSRLAGRTNNSQTEPHNVERRHLIAAGRDQRASFGCDCVQTDIQPAADRVDRRVFPCLQAVSVIHVMCRLPEVEHLIAILDGGQKCRYTVRYEENVECNVQWQVERCRTGAGLLISPSSVTHVICGDSMLQAVYTVS